MINRKSNLLITAGLIIIILAIAIFTTNSIKAHSCATCSSTGTCNACKNCKYCKHCSKDGGTCSVCK